MNCCDHIQRKRPRTARILAGMASLSLLTWACTSQGDVPQAQRTNNSTGQTAGSDNVVASAGATHTFKDPAPPRVTPPPGQQAPAPRPYVRVTHHAKPKPLPQGAVTHDWTSFLGPTHNGVSTETKLLADFPEGGPTLLWELGKGASYASPAIQGEFLVFTHRVDNEGLIECLHPVDGRLYWVVNYPTEYQDRYGYDNGPRASPVIDGDRVYVYTADGVLFCLHLPTGAQIWKRDLKTEFKVPQDFFGTVTTPVVEGNLLIINLGAPGGPCVIGLDKQTGKLAWGAGDQWGPSYSTPVPATVHGRRRVFVFAGGDSRPPVGGLLSIDPANGHVDFQFPWRSESYESVNAACPVVVGNQVMVSASYDTGAALLNIAQDMSAKPAWTTPELGTHWNTAIHKDGYFYAFDGRNEPDASLVCIDAKTGKAVWREEPEWEETIELQGQKQTLTVSTLRGSLMSVDGRFLCLGELGHLLWLDLTPQGYRELDRTWLFAAQHTWALPVLSQGLLYVCQNTRDVIHRTSPRLLCYDLRAGQGKNDSAAKDPKP